MSKSKPTTRRTAARKSAPKSIEAARFERMVKALPATEALDVKFPKLPHVKAPSLEGLEITVPVKPDADENVINDRLVEFLRAKAKRVELKQGEPVDEGDEVCIDMIGYCEGALIPFSLQEQRWMYLDPLPELPGFSEALVGLGVGESREVTVQFPADAAGGLAGKRGSYIVDLRAARALEVPDLNAPKFLQELGFESGDQVLDVLLDEIDDERAASAWMDAERLVLDALAARVKITVSSDLVDRQIKRNWGLTEGPTALRKGLSAKEQQEALDGWLKDPETRTTTERTIRNALLFAAIADANHLKLDAQTVAQVEPELSDEEIAAVLKTAAGTDETALKTRNALINLAALDFVMEKATVKFEGAAGRTVP